MTLWVRSLDYMCDGESRGANNIQCQAEHSPEFADVFYKGIVAQRATLLNLYVAFGGTSWGHSAAPVVSALLGIGVLCHHLTFL